MFDGYFCNKIVLLFFILIYLYFGQFHAIKFFFNGILTTLTDVTCPSIFKVFLNYLFIF